MEEYAATCAEELEIDYDTVDNLLSGDLTDDSQKSKVWRGSLDFETFCNLGNIF